MSLSPAVIRELKKELLTLQRARADVEVRVRNIKAVLKFGGDAAPLGSNLLRYGPSSGQTARSGRVRGRQSIRQLVAEVVAEVPGLKVTEIVYKLKERAVEVSGKTPLYDRVYRELRRLSEKGVVRRDGTAYVSVNHTSLENREQSPLHVG